jgi:hypothetical protein
VRRRAAVLVDVALLVAFGLSAFLAGLAYARARPITFVAEAVSIVLVGGALLAVLRERAADAASDARGERVR